MRISIRSAAVSVGLLVWLVAPIAARSQTVQGTSAPTVRQGAVARVARAAVVTAIPLIDGRLDDAAWKSAEPLTDFIQRELREGEPVTERTEVRVLADAQALYVGAWLYDRQPGGVTPGEKVRDVILTNSDYFALILDTYLDRQNGFVFATTPAGIEYDGQVVKEGEGGGVSVSGQTRAQSGSMGGFNLNWDGSWKVATSTDSAGWYAEFRIPFSTLRYGGASAQTWGLNLARGIRRKNEEAFWAPIPRQFNLYRLSRAGTLEGLRVPVRRVATVTPYVLGGSQRNYLVDAEATTPSEFGADAKYGLTPSLTLDLTYNTDFAQVEVDEQRTNLTRFPLFFPEKRPFFLENAGVFSAGTPQLVDLFFTRRIGIDSLGNPVPIVGGGRVTGRVAGLTVGALQIFTDRAAIRQPSLAYDVPSMSYSVARLAREVGARSRVGVIAVQRMATDDAGDRNRTFGADARWGIGDAWTIDGWGAKTETPGLGGDDVAYSARIDYTTASWGNNARYAQIGEHFNPEVGFLNRFGGYRLYDINFMWKYRRPQWSWFKEWTPHVGYRAYYGLDDFYESGRVHVDMTEVSFANGGRFGPELNIEHEGLREPFEIASGVILPAESYDYASLGLDFATNPSAPLSLSLRGDFGAFYNGTRNGGNATITFRRGAALSTSLLLDYNDVRLDQGDFIRKLLGIRVAYFFTPRIFVQSLVQHSNQAGVRAANVRFGWLNTAGTGLFVVFNDGRETDRFFRGGTPQARSLVVKYTRQFGTGS